MKKIKEVKVVNNNFIVFMEKSGEGNAKPKEFENLPVQLLGQQ